jgi:hypothetical protein
MGVRRVQISAQLIELWLKVGFRVSEALEPVADAHLLEARLAGNPYRVELLIESPTFDGPGAEGRWVDISEGRWDEFPIFLPTFRTLPDRIIVETDRLTTSDGEPLMLFDGPGHFEPVDDADERHGEVPGA